MTDVKCCSVQPQSLADGRVLAPGETATVDEITPHDQALLTEGLLVELPALKAKPKASAAKPKES